MWILSEPALGLSVAVSWKEEGWVGGPCAVAAKQRLGIPCLYLQVLISGAVLCACVGLWAEWEGTGQSWTSGSAQRCLSWRRGKLHVQGHRGVAVPGPLCM
jgi:hypothetical protein